MQDSLLIIILLIFIYIFLFYNHNQLVFVENEKEGTRYLVQNDNNKFESSKLLVKLTKRMYKLRNHLVKNIDKYPGYEKYINLLKKGFNNNRTTISESSPYSNLTSYSVNKGEELVFCLKSKETGKLHKINLLMYVAVHEMAHIGCPEIGHGPLFQKVFRFFTEEAIKLKLYSKEEYDSNPVEYCGMILSSSIV